MSGHFVGTSGQIMFEMAITYIHLFQNLYRHFDLFMPFRCLICDFASQIAIVCMLIIGMVSTHRRNIIDLFSELSDHFLDEVELYNNCFNVWIVIPT